MSEVRGELPETPWWHGKVAVTAIGLLVTKGLVICDRTSRVLLLRRSNDPRVRDRQGEWDTPGGFAKPEELHRPRLAFLRELEEETGIVATEESLVELTPPALPFPVGSQPLDIRLYAMYVPEEGVPRFRHEHDLHEWRDPHTLGEEVGSLLQQLTRKI